MVLKKGVFIKMDFLRDIFELVSKEWKIVRL
jgi:hypothetical protein